MPANQEVSPYNLQPFRRAVFRGLGLVLPPLLTFVILLWIGSSVQKFVLSPVEWGSRRAAIWWMNRTLTQVPVGVAVTRSDTNAEEALEQPTGQLDSNSAQSAPSPELQPLVAAIQRLERKIDATTDAEASLPRQRENESWFEFEDRRYVQLGSGEWIPQHVRDAVNGHVRASGIPLANSSGKGYYSHYVEYLVLTKSRIIPVFLSGFILLMYLLGKFLAAGFGRIFWNSIEGAINQLPIIRTVYSSVKQVTDFFVGESDIDFQRVVAVEYPRKGIWSVGFVTGESLLTLRGAAKEAVVSVLVPTSPVPGTGFTITVRKSDTIDLDLPIEQALQFVVSCGVVIPDEEDSGAIEGHIRDALEENTLIAG